MHDKECRICLSHWKYSTIMIDLFDEQNGHLKRQIHSITGIQIREINGQPRYICNNCLMDLESAIKFRQRCIMSEKQLIAAVTSEETFCEPPENFIKFGNDIEDDLIEEVYEEDLDSKTEVVFEPAKQVEDDDTEQPEFINLNEVLCLGSQQKTTAGNPTKSSSKTFGPYVCDECGRSINHISNFREHKLRHTGIKNFMCKFCRKFFATKKELIRHVRQHTGERPYACSYCTSKFADLGTVRQHERRHINSRPYECTECGKRFFSSSCLSKHRLIHKALPRSHQCVICDVWFHRAGHLRAHMNCRSHKLKAHAAKLASMLS